MSARPTADLKSFGLFLSALLLFGCARTPDHRYSRLQTGMTKQQVIALLGPPKATTSTGALITMEYDFTRRETGGPVAVELAPNSYYVIIGRDERVRSFGPN